MNHENPAAASCCPLNSDLAVTQKECEKKLAIRKIIGAIRVEVEGHFFSKKRSNFRVDSSLKHKFTRITPR